MKKIISIILSVVMMFSIACQIVYAEENYEMAILKIDAGDGVKIQRAIIIDDEILIPACDFPKYTRYEYYPEGNYFLIKGQLSEKAFKIISVNEETKEIIINTDSIFTLSEIIKYDGKLYLPVSEMLPVLNADIYNIEKDTIYISNNELSLAEVLYSFDPTEYVFNFSEEFNNSKRLAYGFFAPSFVLDTILGLRIDRLDVIHSSGTYNDYKDIFSEFLKDDSLYFKALEQNPEYEKEIINYFKNITGVSKDLNSAYKWIEEAGKSDISDEVGGFLLERLRDGYNSGELEVDDIKGLNDVWIKGDIPISDIVKSVDYLYTYVNHIEDNREMLNSVYSLDTKTKSSNVERKAAKQVYDLYGKDVVPAVINELAKTMVEDALKELNPVGVYTSAIKYSDVILSNALPFDYGDISKLTLYSDIAYNALFKYESCDTKTDISTNDLRLSLLLSMIASKKCNEIMEDTFKGAGKNAAVYTNRINKIEKIITGLYIAGKNTEFDSYENYVYMGKDNKKRIKQSNIGGYIKNNPVKIDTLSKQIYTSFYGGNTDRSVTEFAYEYDERNNIVKHGSYDKNGNINWGTFYKYDKNNNLIEKLTSFEKTQYIYNSNNQMVEERYEIYTPTSSDYDKCAWYYEYEKDKIITKTQVYKDYLGEEHKIEDKNEYDKNGNIINTSKYHNGLIVESTDYFYENGRLVESKYEGTWTPIAYTNSTYGYDDSGNNIYIYEIETYEYADGETETSFTEWNCEFESNGNLTRKTRSTNGVLYDVYRYKYDEYNRVIKEDVSYYSSSHSITYEYLIN